MKGRGQLLKKKQEIPAPGAPLWNVTYGDMVTLVLCFFVALFAFSSVDSKKFQEMQLSLRTAFGGPGGVMTGNPSVFDAPIIRQTQIQQMYEEIKKVIDENKWKGQAEVSITERGITISFKEKLFFKIGSAQIMPEAESILESVGKVLKERRYPLRIEGHTCNLPIRSAQFPSNWELSAIRAINVTKFLINRVGFEPERISVAGYGPYHPLVKNDSEENRARNRRVDIVIITGLAKNNAVNVINKPTVDGGATN